MILMETNRALSARDMCEQIQQKLPPMLARHKDPMASVTTVLNRLVEYGEARTVILENGRRAWQWVAEPDPQSSSRVPPRKCSHKGGRGSAPFASRQFRGGRLPLSTVP